MNRNTLAIGFVTAAVVLSSAAASAQYFGRNKVHYQDFDFKILRTDHFDVYYYGEERQGAEIAARMAERWHARLGRIFDHELRGRQPLILYGSHPAFEQTNVIRGELGEGTGGVTEPVRRRIVLPLAGPLGETDHVIGHELVHAYQFDITTRPDSPTGRNGAQSLPLWFIEGMAEYLSLGPVDPNTAMWLRDALLQHGDEDRDQLPSIDELDNPKYFPYRWGQAFWAYVGGRFGDGAIRRMLAMAAAAGDYHPAIEKVLGMKTEALSRDWQSAIRQAYRPVLAGTTRPGQVGRIAVEATELGGANVGPALSPDGHRVAFLSTRSIFSTDLFVAETATGKILRQLTSTATDPHFSSLEFIYSAGTWDREGRRLAIATVSGGKAALTIFDADTGDKQREITLDAVDEIVNPTWAPDGHAVCFSGLHQGLTDLYLFDLGTAKLTALTHDAYADVQPAWSPKGDRIAFVTDRFTSHLDTLAMGDYRLAVIDPESGRIEQVDGVPGRNLNPQWTPDGDALLFIAEPDGIPNVYRIAVAGGSAAQVTNVATGISGITATSPALSVAGASGAAAFSVYADGKYSIHMLEASAARSARVERPREFTRSAAILPPIDRRQSDVAALLRTPQIGLPAESRTFATDPYNASLSLENVLPPSVAVGATRFGPAIAGGIGLQFSDMLGNHTLLATVQAQTGGGGSSFSYKDIAGGATYLNEAHRWEWGLTGSQVPYVSGSFQSGVANSDAGPVQVERSVLFRQTEQTGAGLVAYPFNRADRVELQGGVSRITFDRTVQTQVFSLGSGQLIADDSNTTQAQSPLTLATSSAALVHDTANFGATSPVAGSRYRFEASPTFGEIQYTGLLADYRRYFMPVPFYTVATRLLHYGRYGSGGEDQRLFPLFLGYPNLVRGYDVGSFDAAECVPTSASQCPAFDRLLGSRVLVANAELRFPLLRPFGASQRMYGPVPVEMALFGDAGVAWSRGESPSIFGGSRHGVASAGVAFRVNLLGFAIGQFDFAHPFQRDRRGWVFQFNLSPGF